MNIFLRSGSLSRVLSAPKYCKSTGSLSLSSSSNSSGPASGRRSLGSRSIDSLSRCSWNSKRTKELSYRITDWTGGNATSLKAAVFDNANNASSTNDGVFIVGERHQSLQVRFGRIQQVPAAQNQPWIDRLTLHPFFCENCYFLISGSWLKLDKSAAR